MISLKQLEEKKVLIISSLDDINNQIDEVKGKTVVQCTNNNRGKGCGMGILIKDIDYIQTYWYESPHGCMGGDSWHMGDGEFECPFCGHRNRLYDRLEIVELKYLFKSVIEEHER